MIIQQLWSAHAVFAYQFAQPRQQHFQPPSFGNLRDEKSLQNKEKEFAYVKGEEWSLPGEGESVLPGNESLRVAIKGLSEKRKRVLVLYFYRGIPISRIAKELCVEKQTVRNHLADAIKLLRKELATVKAEVQR